MMHTMPNPEQNKMGNQPLENAGIQIVVGKVVSLDAKAHAITLGSGEAMAYERLVLATRTESVMLPMLTSAPTVHPLTNAAHLALAKLRAGRS
jgi:NADPH-dependent 2,4-dienoyl-CoA reductase/sulfur reductase-like enzyme